MVKWLTQKFSENFTSEVILLKLQSIYQSEHNVTVLQETTSTQKEMKIKRERQIKIEERMRERLCCQVKCLPKWQLSKKRNSFHIFGSNSIEKLQLFDTTFTSTIKEILLFKKFSSFSDGNILKVQIIDCNFFTFFDIAKCYNWNSRLFTFFHRLFLCFTFIQNTK